MTSWNDIEKKKEIIMNNFFAKIIFPLALLVTATISQRILSSEEEALQAKHLNFLVLLPPYERFSKSDLLGQLSSLIMTDLFEVTASLEWSPYDCQGKIVPEKFKFRIQDVTSRTLYEALWSYNELLQRVAALKCPVPTVQNFTQVTALLMVNRELEIARSQSNTGDIATLEQKRAKLFNDKEVL
jgi:hypothetical protein